MGLLLVLLAIWPFSREAGCLLTILMALYITANLLASCITCLKTRQLRFLPVLPLIFAAFHVGYGWGFLWGVIDFIILRRGGRRSFSQVTR